MKIVSPATRPVSTDESKSEIIAAQQRQDGGKRKRFRKRSEAARQPEWQGIAKVRTDGKDTCASLPFAPDFEGDGETRTIGHKASAAIAAIQSSPASDDAKLVAEAVIIAADIEAQPMNRIAYALAGDPYHYSEYHQEGKGVIHYLAETETLTRDDFEYIAKDFAHEFALMLKHVIDTKTIDVNAEVSGNIEAEVSGDIESDPVPYWASRFNPSNRQED